MKAYLALTFAMLASFLITSSPALAHHGASMFDMEHSVSVKGAVTDFEWANPHVMIYANVKDSQGNARKWAIELRGSPNVETKAGWTKETIKPGDKLTFVGHPAKNGSDNMRLEKVVLPNGMELYPDPPHGWF